MTTRDQILAVVGDKAPTPMSLVRTLEHEYPDTRSMLLRLIAEGTVSFDVDGKLRIRRSSERGEQTAASSHA